MKIQNMLGGVVVAVVVALPFVVPRIAGVDTWKIVLGLAGLTLFVSAGMGKA